MVVSESDMMSQGEVESPLAPGGEPKNQALTLGRQSSIYSLTLDEFQHTLCDSGKNFGSMNMDEFLNSIWTAEENQAGVNTTGTASASAVANHGTHGGNNMMNFGHGESPSGSPIAKQPSLPRQGSLTIPAPLGRKIVDEVWSEIHKNQHGTTQHASNVQTSGSAHRHPTFGEMTLEDFLVKAGVVREQNTGMPTQQQIPATQQQQQPQFNMYQNTSHPGFVTRTPPLLAVGGHGGGVSPTSFIPHGAVGAGGVADLSGYVANGKRNSGAYPTQACYGGRVGNGTGDAGYGVTQSLAMDTTVSSVSSEGMGPNQMDNVGNQYGMDLGGMRGSSRKRIIDGPVEKVVERRQRRMIKNRESAARSRARKQAYTVELEAELNQLREENAQLRQALTEVERKRKQQYIEETQKRAQAKGQRAADKLRIMRRALSGPV